MLLDSNPLLLNDFAKIPDQSLIPTALPPAAAQQEHKDETDKIYRWPDGPFTRNRWF